MSAPRLSPAADTNLILGIQRFRRQPQETRSNGASIGCSQVGCFADSTWFKTRSVRRRKAGRHHCCVGCCVGVVCAPARADRCGGNLRLSVHLPPTKVIQPCADKVTVQPTTAYVKPKHVGMALHALTASRSEGYEPVYNKTQKNHIANNNVKEQATLLTLSMKAAYLATWVCLRSGCCASPTTLRVCRSRHRKGASRSLEHWLGPE